MSYAMSSSAAAPAPAGAPGGSRRPATDHACYLYGIVPATVREVAVDSPLGEVTLLPHRRIAALIGRAPAHRRTRHHIVAHAQVLDRMAATGPVLPMRFGTVLASPAAVADEILAPHHDSFAAALDSLAATAQFTVRARYIEDEIVREVIAEEPQVSRLQQRLRRRTGGPDQAGRMRLGELLARAVAAKREADTSVLVAMLRPHAAATQVQISQSVDADRIADAACLVDRERRTEFESAVEELGSRWRGRARLRLLGPMAPYDFVDGLVQVGGR